MPGITTVAGVGRRAPAFEAGEEAVEGVARRGCDQHAVAKGEGNRGKQHENKALSWQVRVPRRCFDKAPLLEAIAEKELTLLIIIIVLQKNRVALLPN